ncbi:MAG: carboxyl transferase domain-containing protein [SAR202 cluster bacterium]|nr:carboxyl transferase domain-containing protein [SAR202 cluster bacterium]MDP6302405.1 carboxyl transferase domain-containing protein [SAR202 cluster bacterium]MDP7103420.1 carboxyl transferase domain-containing protein [SAR202 cluster bacterium]MDP7223715.1 carboxyl transferase domain-containing protein [SAR202 cluster bacterium]MDP7412156.1 carboxyl transferase domain-containing protein [SAR202 cluster bacterium]
MPIDLTRESWKPGMPWEKAVDDINYIHELAKEMGGQERIDRQHNGGRYTIRERIDKMVDPGSFMESGPMVGAAEFDAEGNLTGFTPGGYVMGLGEIDGRPVAIGGDDFTISGGSPHNVHKNPQDFVQPLAIQYGIPYVQLIEGVGHSSKSDEASGHMGLPNGGLWWRNAEVLRRVPCAAGIMGAVAGWPAAHALMSHFTVMIKKQSQIFPSGPPVVRRAIGETLDKEELGGHMMHVHESGQVDNEAESEEDAFDQIKKFISYLPDTTNDVAPRVETGDPPDRRPEELLTIIPANRKRSYDPRKLIRLVVDNGEFFEMRRHWAGAIITGFARLDGYSVGVLGSDPTKLAGAMDGDGADKYAHFVDLCDAFNLPVVIFLDMPGFMLGSHAERKATMRRGIRALIASAEADVPKIEFNVRKSYGVAADAPNSLGHPNGLNLRFGWPAGEWGGIPIEGGVAAAYRREIEAAPDPDAHRQMIEDRLLKMRSPFRAAHKGDVVDLIDPRDTRRLACKFVKLAQPMLAKLAQRPKRAVRP